MPDVIITGIPRAGTTLASALVDSLPDTVCLNEPDWHTGRRAATAQDFAKWLVGDFVQTRKKLLAGQAVPDRRSQEGQALTNYFRADPISGDMQVFYQVVPFTREDLSPDFTLAIKHNGPYLAALKPIIETGWFASVIAIVRHPVRVIHSWRNLSLPISRGEMPGAVHYWPRMAELVKESIDLLEKQVKLYDLMCMRIHALRDHLHLLPYETLVSNPQQLAEYAGSKAQVNPSLVSPSLSPIPPQDRQEIIQALKIHGEAYKHFYPDLDREDI